MERLEIYPTHHHGDFLLRAGKPLPFGATLIPNGVNFAIYSQHATHCTLVLFEKGADKPLAEIPFPNEFRIGHVFAMIVFHLDYEKIEYGYRFAGPHKPHTGQIFNPSQIVLDPYAKDVSGRNVWGVKTNSANFAHRGRLVSDDFDWLSDRSLQKKLADLVIYELHVRGFSRHPSSGVKYAGSYAGLREKIPYLSELGINCIELMPIQEFDELENKRINPLTGERLVNYWGYDPVNFFAPKAGYAGTGKEGLHVDECKAMIKELHRHNIEVWLDVVFNHSGEGDETGPTISFRGIDNKTYYLLKPDGSYYNFSGCGNTLNCNHPVVRNLVRDCLRYWVAEYHVDGFRFDLASILGRDSGGHALANPPLIESIAYDPVLGKTKLIAEAWDAGGLYQVGSFPSYGRWSEWNGKYRDTLRQFLKGDAGQVGEMALRILGSPDLYPEQGPTASINFITCHDGFTLADLFSYDEKRNEANGEDSRDGANANYSWNCGWEGATHDPEINRLRRRMMKNAFAILLASQGVPLLSMGDEVAHTKRGNNNTYCQDNELSWLDWSRRKTEGEIFRFCQQMIAFRYAHPVLRSETHLRGKDYVESGYADISWHGVRAWHPDWSPYCRTLAFMLNGDHARQGTMSDEDVYVGMNMFWEGLTFELPRLPASRQWHLFVNTFAPPPQDIVPVGSEVVLVDQHQIWIAPRSVVILVGRTKNTTLGLSK